MANAQQVPEVFGQSLTPDFTETGTAAVLEAEYNGLKFTGPGWYFMRNGDAAIILPIDRPFSRLMHQKHADGELFRMYVYCQSGSDIAGLIGALSIAPTRQDERR